MEEGIRGVYIISVASRLLAMHPQTLRKYERLGLITPSRTLGMLRLYSDRDMERLRLIKHLVENEDLNLAGVELSLQIWDRLVTLRESLAEAGNGRDLRRAVEEHLDGIFELLESSDDSEDR
ncbi:MAG: MerR family transcriptional regulator [Dehalococcoidia bacterium]|nr:MerR family transcriptional regulator [Dehalococcoidia bacterium]